MGRIFLLVFTLMLAGCVSPIETYVSASGVNAAVAGQTILAEPDIKRDANGQLAQAAVTDRLTTLEIMSVAADAVYRLEVTFAVLPANLSVRAGAGTATATAPPIKRRKPPRKSRRCDPANFRLGILLSRISDGETAYRSSAQEYHCRGTEPAFIDQMAMAALADFGHPKGDYLIERPRPHSR